MGEDMHSAFRKSSVLVLALLLASFDATAHAGDASAAPAGIVTLENLSYAFHGLRLTYPKIEITGANLSKAEIEKLVSPETSIPVWLATAKNLNAASIDIPSVTIAIDTGVIKGEMSCTGMKAARIANGKLGDYTIGHCSGEIADKSGTPLNIAFDHGAWTDFNFVHLYRLWADKAGPDDKEAVSLYATGAFDGFSLSISQDSGHFKMTSERETEAEGPKIKLLASPIREIMEELVTQDTKAGKGDESLSSANDNTWKRAALMAIAFGENYQSSVKIIKNFGLSITSRDNGILQRVNIGIASIRSSPGYDQQFTDIAFETPQATGKIGAISWNGFSMAPFLAQARQFVVPAEKPNAPTEKEPVIYSNLFGNFAGGIEPLVFAPYASLGTISVHDVDMTLSDVMTPTENGLTAQTAKVSLSTFTLKLGEPFNGFPTAGRVTVDHLRMPAAMTIRPEQSNKADYLLGLRQAGLDPVDISLAVDLDWNRKSKTIDLKEYSFTLNGFFGFIAKGTFGNASEDLFSWNSVTRENATANLTTKAASLHVEDQGGIDRIVKVAAAHKGVRTEELKAFFPIMVALIPQPYISMKSVRTVRDAVLAFWQAPGRLDISFRARSENGFGSADLAAAKKDPKILDEKAEITASATK